MSIIYLASPFRVDIFSNTFTSIEDVLIEDVKRQKKHGVVLYFISSLLPFLPFWVERDLKEELKIKKLGKL